MRVRDRESERVGERSRTIDKVPLTNFELLNSKQNALTTKRKELLPIFTNKRSLLLPHERTHPTVPSSKNKLGVFQRTLDILQISLTLDWCPSASIQQDVAFLG